MSLTKRENADMDFYPELSDLHQFQVRDSKYGLQLRLASVFLKLAIYY